jgi:hypothetical protein
VPYFAPNPLLVEAIRNTPLAGWRWHHELLHCPDVAVASAMRFQWHTLVILVLEFRVTKRAKPTLAILRWRNSIYRLRDTEVSSNYTRPPGDVPIRKIPRQITSPSRFGRQFAIRTPLGQPALLISWIFGT